MALSTSRTALAVTLAAVAALADGVQAAAGDDDCFSSASVVGAVIGTIVVLLGLEAGVYALWRLYWRSRRGQHLVLVTDPEKGGEFAFDNPCFKDATPVSKAVLDAKDPAKMDQKNKWTSWGGLGAIKNNLGGLQGEKRRAMDDSFPTEPQVTQVSLRSHDFTGLGFNICGNMRDGIFVKDVLHRGPASESGLIFPGDRIHGIRISLKHMVFEDALTILSYASPYEVTLEVETGTAGASRPSSLLRREREREKEKEALAQVGLAPADRIVHPFYRSQSIADLAQIGKGTQKRSHAIDSPARSVTPSDYPTLKLMHAGLHTSTPHAHAHAASTAVIAPSSNVVVVKPERASNPHPVHKMGVRVLPGAPPAAEPTEKRQNVHNAYLERGIDVPDGYNPYSSTAAAPAPAGFHDVDLGGGERTSSPTSPSSDSEHHKVGVVAKEVKTKLSKGLHNLLHSLDRNKKGVSKDEVVVTATTQPRGESTLVVKEVEVAPAVPEEVMTRKPSGRGIPTEIPEEVRLAAMAARNNRKSLGALSVEVVEAAAAAPTTAAVVETDRASSRNSSSSGERGPPRRSKGLAPRPPSAPATPSPASPKGLGAEGPPLVNGEEELHSDSDSEVEVAASAQAAPATLTTIELTASHVTVHHGHGLDEENTRKAASLGDLSRIEDQMTGVAVLERAVSLDLDAPGHGKKRKAPAAPALDDDDDDLSLDAMDDVPYYKEPRLDVGLGHGLGLNTFERSRLKKSSDWGTLEEALKDGDDQVRVLSPPAAPTVAEVIPKGELRSSFFVGTKFGHDDVPDDQPFSFTASSMEPLSIEVRAESVEAEVFVSPATPASPSGTAERDRVLWSVPADDGASRVSVSAPSSAGPVSVSVSADAGVGSTVSVSSSSVAVASSTSDVVSVSSSPPAGSPPADAAVSVNASAPPPAAEPAEPAEPMDLCSSGPSSLSSLTIVSSTPMRPQCDVNPALQSPIVTSTDVLRASASASGFVTTMQLNSLEDAGDAAFLTAVDSSTLMEDALDVGDDVTSTPSPPLPTSPIPVNSPMSSLTYITEIQVVTTPDSSSSRVVNGFASPPASPRESSDHDATPVLADVEAAVGRTATPPASSPAVRVNGDATPPATSSPASPSASTPTTPTPSKAGRNVSVTAIQGSRIPVRAASHSPDERRSSSGSAAAGVSASNVSAPPPSSSSASPVRPPVPARRSAEHITPRKANGVHVVQTQTP